MTKGISVPITVGFDDRRVVGRLTLSGDVSEEELAVCVLAPAVRILENGKLKVIEYGIVSKRAAISGRLMRRRLRSGGAEI